MLQVLHVFRSVLYADDDPSTHSDVDPTQRNSTGLLTLMDVCNFGNRNGKGSPLEYVNGY